MIYLIQEETTLFTLGITTRTEIKGTYNKDRMDKRYFYKELSKLK